MHKIKTNKNVLITGASSGLGYALAESFTSNGWKSTNLGRKNSPACQENILADLSDLKLLDKKIKKFPLSQIKKFDLIILNAAILGEINRISFQNEDSIMQVMKTNFFSNKIILDYILNNIDKSNLNIIAISSGASQNPISGWSSYCISKASLNMLISCYAKEYPQHHFVSLCPGFVKSDMQKQIKNINPIEFPEIVGIQEKFDKMPMPKEVANLFIKKIEKIQNIQSGKFLRLNNL